MTKIIQFQISGFRFNLPQAGIFQSAIPANRQASKWEEGAMAKFQMFLVRFW